MVALLAISTLGAGAKAFADETTSEAKSEATITFTNNTETTGPTDPVDPDTDGNNNGTNNPGPLSLDVVPTLPFGERTINDAAAGSAYPTFNTNPRIQVSDTRTEADGWHVTAKMAALTNTDDSTKTLGGAKIVFKEPVVISRWTVSGGNATENTDEVGTTGILAPSFTLNSDGTLANVASAQNGSGLRTTLFKYNGANTKLVLDGAVDTEGTYKSDITWTLSSTPTF